MTSGGSSCFRTCPYLPGDALIELDLRCGLRGLIPLLIVTRLFRRCRRIEFEGSSARLSTHCRTGNGGKT